MFELLDHPADIGFRAHSRTLPELFENAALALLSIAGDPAAASPSHRYPITADGSDHESLLVNWLNEVLYWFDGKRIAFREVRVERMESEIISGVGVGEPRDPDRHRARLIVKAVTYHQLKVQQTSDGWLAEVYLDI
jgi:SHS2 domain-containing protein